jgi:hypothetical protein
MAIWLRGLKHWYLVLGGVAVGHGFEPHSNLELFFAEISIRVVINYKSGRGLRVGLFWLGIDVSITNKHFFTSLTHIYHACVLY